MTDSPSHTADPEPGLTTARQRRARRRWLAVALALVAVGAAARAALPALLRSVGESQGSKFLGSELSIGNVDLWLLSGALVVEGVRLGDAGAGPGLAVDRAALRVGWRDLAGGTLRLRTLELDGPKLRLWRRPNGAVEFLPAPPTETAVEPERSSTGTDSPPTAASAKQGSETPTETGDGGWPIAVDRLVLNGVEVVMRDQRFDEPSEATFRVEQLAVTEIELRGSRLGLGSIEIEGPTLHFPPALALPAGESAAGPEAAAEPAAPGQPFGFGLKQLDIRRAGVFVVGDRPVDVAFHLAAREITASPNTLFPARLDLSVGGEEGERTLTVDGRLGLAPLAFEGRVEWSGLILANLIAPFAARLAPWMDAGNSSGALDVSLRLPAPAGEGTLPDGLRASGEIRVDDLALADDSRAGEDASLAWSSLEVDVREIRVPFGEAVGPVEVSLARVVLRDPALHLTRAGSGGPGGEAANAAGDPEKAAAEPAASGGVRVQVDALELSGGELSLLDRSVQPFYRGKLSQIRLSARDARWPETSVRELSLATRTDDDATLTLRGSLTSGARSGEARVELENLPLRSFNPYATRFTAYRVERGSATLHSDVRLDDARTETKNSLELHDFDLTEQSEGEFKKSYGVPLQLGLALMRDVGGNIALAVPLELSDSGAKLGLGSLIRGALQRAILGALTSPLKAVGMLIPKGESIASLATAVACEPGRAETTANGASQVALLAKVLASRPALSLALRGRVGEADRPTLARDELRARAEAGGAWPEIEGGSWLVRRRVRTALAAEAVGEPAPLAPDDAQALGRWIAAVEVPEARTRDLAARRAAGVRDALLTEHGFTPARVRAEPDAVAGDPGVTAELEVSRGDADEAAGDAP